MEAVYEGFVSNIQKLWDYGFYAIKNSSGDFLSVIFGIYGKFHVDIGVQKFFEKMFSSRKKHFTIFLNTYANLKFSVDSKNRT